MSKGQPTRRRLDAARAQRAHGDALRDWIQRRRADLERARAKAAEKRRKKDAKKAKEAEKRPPELTVSREWIHQHAGRPYVPYVNPDRDAKSLRSGRLRKDLRP